MDRTRTGRGRPRWPGRRAVVAALAVLAALAPAGCGGQRVAAETVDRFVRAVQARDVDVLYCLMAGAAAPAEPDGTARDGETPAQRRERFAAWARSRYEAYEAQRDAGLVRLDDPLVAARLFALGSGTFYSRETVRTPRPRVMTLDTRLRFGYAAVDLSGFSPGTTFYVNGPVPGRVHAVRVPAGSREVSLEVLDSLLLRWVLVDEPASAGCPAGWRVASAEPVEGTVETVDLTWVF